MHRLESHAFPKMIRAMHDLAPQTRDQARQVWRTLHIVRQPKIYKVYMQPKIYTIISLNQVLILH